MFLDPEGLSIKDKMHKQFTSAFKLAYEINAAVHELTDRASITHGDLQQLVLAPLLLRALTTYQGAILLAERGLPAEGKILARSLLEILFRTTAIAKDRRYAEIYVLEDQRLRRKLINKSKLLSADLQQPFLTELTNQIESELANDIFERQIEEKSTQWWANEAGLSDIYNTAYAIFSIAVHAGSRDLTSHLQLDENKNIIAMQMGPNSAELDMVTLSVCDSLLLIIRATASVFPAHALETVSMLQAKLESINTTPKRQ